MSDSAARAEGPSLRAMMLAMALAIVAVTALAFWDERRESTDAFEAFAREQSELATAAGAALSALLDDEPAPATLDGSKSIVARLRSIEQRGSVVLLARGPSPSDTWMTAAGAPVSIPAIAQASEIGRPWVRLARSDAAALGLPARTAIAGLRTIDAGARGRWSVAIVATARFERDREVWAERRLVLSVLVACGLVLVFGGGALRIQRRQLESTRELAIAEIRRSRDDRLLRADKLATMGALATGIAHEVSTPLGVILGRAEQLASRVSGDERAQRAVGIIVEQSERIRRVISGFLTLARGGSPSLERVRPDAIVRAAVQLVEHRFAAAKVFLETDIAPALPKLACEPRLFEQALVNLLLNACDACAAEGHVCLRVRSDGERVAFIVADDGVGISVEEAARAAEPFFTTKPEGLGTGLGLAIATEIVKHHQGNLDIMPGGDGGAARGTRVCVEIPAIKEASLA